MTYVICSLISIIANLKSKDSKFANLLFLFILWFVGGLSTIRPDYIPYNYVFEGYSLNLGIMTEPLYLWINKLAFGTGISYDTFFAIQVALSLILFYYAISFFKPRKSIVLTLFLLYPFAINVVQIRFFLAFSIIICAFKFLFLYYKTRSLKYLIYYVSLVLIATLVHYSAIFFLICIIPFLYHDLGIIKTFCLSFSFDLFLLNLNTFIALFVPLIGERKALAWFANSDRPSLMHILMVLLIRLCILLICYLSMHIPHIALQNDGNSRLIDSFLFNLLVFLVIIIIPLELQIQQYERLTRVYLIIFYILVARRIPQIIINNRMIFVSCLTIVMGMICLYSYSRGLSIGAPFFNTVFRSIFESNLLFM